MNLPPSVSPLLEKLLREERFSEDDRRVMREFAEKGYLVVDFDMEDFEARTARIIERMAPRYPKDDRRVMEAWYYDDDVRRIAAHGKILDLLRLLYQREPIPFQTLNFDKGTQQSAHSDTIHFHCVPHRYMCGVWVSFEDIDADNGPLIVHPGSHKLPILDMFDLGLEADTKDYGGYESGVREILEANGYPSKELHVEKGKAVIWAANLFHGGGPIRNPQRTRHSQVTHYYFEDCFYYFPMGSDPFARRFCLREAVDLRTGRMMPQTYRGRELHPADYEQFMKYERPLPDWVTGADAPVKPTAIPETALEMPAEPQEAVQYLKQNVEELRKAVRALEVDNGNLRSKVNFLEGNLRKAWKKLPSMMLGRVKKTFAPKHNNKRDG